jgi:2-iminobutanoate/2-iminopropanoate deaminase
MKHFISHPEKPNGPGQLSSAIRCGAWIHVSGQGPLDMKTAQYRMGTIEEETALTLSHIEKILAEAGAKKTDIVKCTAYLSNLEDFPGYHRTFQEFFAGGPLPCRTTVGAPLLRGIKVEIDAVAFVE